MLSGSQTTSGDNVFNTVERKTVGTKLKVTPQVNEGDAVLLEIEQEVSSVDSSSNSTLGPTFNTRTIQNAVLVKTGETVVTGGLLDDFSKEQVSKVPLLGDIPLVGQLFRYTSTERAKRNLMVFIRPTIIRDDDVYRSLSKRNTPVTVRSNNSGSTGNQKRWLARKICRCWMKTRSTVTPLRHRHGEAFI